MSDKMKADCAVDTGHREAVKHLPQSVNLSEDLVHALLRFYLEPCSMDMDADTESQILMAAFKSEHWD